jgi:hypothetical protein
LVLLFPGTCRIRRLAHTRFRAIDEATQVI